MDQPQLPFVPKFITSKAILTYFVVLGVCFAVFPHKLPFLWIGFGITEMVCFFYFLNRLSFRWYRISDTAFRRKLFSNAFWIRAIYVVFIYFFYQLMNGNPFEFEAADSMGYHNEGIWITELVTAGNFSEYFNKFNFGVSDTGYPLYLSIIYTFSFKSIIVARVINALLSAWMCLMLYKIAGRNFGEQTARITGIMAMLLPNFIFYAGLHVKENTMVFFLVAFIERADFMLHSPQRKPWLLVQIVLLGTSLFFFRTVMAAAAWFALFSALLFIPNKVVDINRRLTFVIWISLASLFIFSGRIMSEVSAYAEGRFTNQTERMTHLSTRKDANKYAKYGSTAVFLPLMVAAPFPTLVNVADQPNSMMINGAVFTRNIYAFFVIIALFLFYKRRLFLKNTLILAFLFAYLLILAMSGFALSERFHMPLLPFLLLLAGYGINQMDKKLIRYYVPYLILIVFIVIGWNWFKMAGRGVI